MARKAFAVTDLRVSSGAPTEDVSGGSVSADL